jgi:polygalacturonase
MKTRLFRYFKINNWLVASIVLLFLSINPATARVQIRQQAVQAPFKMPAITVPDFSQCKKLPITDFGAEKGNKAKNTAAIAKAIDLANKADGGVVVIPEGEWLTGAVHLKSNVNLHLEKGALLLFSEDPKDYLPAVHSSWEGLECFNYSPLIYAYRCKNIAITGEGEIKAKMDVWKQWAGRPSGHMNSLKRLYYMAYDKVPVNQRIIVNDSAHFRPQFIQLNRCENVLLSGFKITNSPFWTVHLYLTKNIVMRNLNIYAHGHNNDGLDPEMCQNLLVENCTFDQGDDAIAVKSGRAPEGWRSKTPSKNIVIRNCTMVNGHQLLAVGSELSGGIENVLVENCRTSDSVKMFHLVFIKSNERMGGYVKNIYVKNITGGNMQYGALGIETDVLYQWKNLVPTLIRKLTPISDIYLENIKAKSGKFISRILGQPELPVKNVHLKNVSVEQLQRDKKHIQENINNFESDN